MIANVLMWAEFAQKFQKSLRTTAGLSMGMKYEFEAGYNWSILGKVR